MAQKPWEHAKSAGSEEDALAARFVESLSYDTRLYKHDIAGSIAHARMLCHVELINADELAEIERGLGEIESEIEAAKVTEWGGWDVELEDVHMCIEAALIEKIGEPGRKLHTGRSRNDQVALDLFLWINQAQSEIITLCESLEREFIRLAERDGEVVIPSYTHLQRAQPAVVGGEVLAWMEAINQAKHRLGYFDGEAWKSPLGSGAIAGSALQLDRQYIVDSLGHTGSFHEPGPSSIYSTASRDVAIDFVYALSMTSMWLSRWAEQWIIYMTAEFNMLTIGDAYTTGSSMMPQKRNPDMLELIRGRCGNVYGHLVSLLTICKGITIGYNRDLQEDKRHVFAAYDTVRDCLQMATGIVRSAKFKSPDMSKGYMDATSLAEYLVTKGVAFRTAHQYVGTLVRHCIDGNITQLQDLSVADMNKVAETPPENTIADDIYDWLGADNVVKRYQTYGNAGLSGYKEQLAAWKQRLGDSNLPSLRGREGLGEGTHVSAAGAPSQSTTSESGASPTQPPPVGEGPNNLFGDKDTPLPERDAALIAAYESAGRTLDDLPYTDEFEQVHAAAGQPHGIDRADVLRRLLNLRKAGKLPQLGRAKEKPPIVDDEQAAILAQLVCEKVGDLGARDRLPHTAEFADVVETFNTRTGLSFSAYQVWRVVAKLAK